MAKQLVVDSDGELELAYNIYASELHLARTEDGVWLTEKVLAPKEGDAYVSRLAVRDPSRPYILIGSETPGVRVPGGWSFTALDDLLYPDIDILVSGNPILCGTTLDSKLVCRTAG